ncbi:LysE family translocator [Rhodobacteraceae bacterium 2376]|uniref:LysE family translocator n=1 Tax=Rhabdonatronobacter sediminivivens TaxID=2743469 RepID=A0A7Z0HWN7_9RHOB|nr:LysE family translocator [Rhabdonatronobacter sediminivivens]NYS23607.1 LysE family translocator [Rhabdonatronobacter sediminivivens]
MTLAHLLAFNVTLLAAFLSPGPAMLYALRNTLRGGLWLGFVTGCGLGLVAAGWTLAAFLGLQAVFLLVPWAYGAMKLAGATYLIWLAWHIWRNAGGALPGTPERATGQVALRAFGMGMLVNLANPKSVLFAAAVLVVIFPAGMAPAQIALIVGNHLLLEVLGYGLIAWALSRPAARAAYMGARRRLDQLSALVLGALGLRLLAPMPADTPPTSATSEVLP